MKFEKLDNSKTSVVESNITKEWKEMDILKRSIETRKDGEKWVFYDDQFMRMLNLESITYLQKLLKMLFVNIRLCKDIEF